MYVSTSYNTFEGLSTSELQLVSMRQSLQLQEYDDDLQCRAAAQPQTLRACKATTQQHASLLSNLLLSQISPISFLTALTQSLVSQHDPDIVLVLV